MANSVRGEIVSDLFGKPMIFCLTLGALAEIESVLAPNALPQFIKRIGKGEFTAHDVTLVLAAASRAGGCTLTAGEIDKLPMNGGYTRAYRLAADLLSACFDDTP